MGYNGWKNYETWNVALWIGNDEGLYSIAREIKARSDEAESHESLYAAFAETMRELESLETPDRVSWTDSGLDTDRLDEMIQEL